MPLARYHNHDVTVAVDVAVAAVGFSYNPIRGPQPGDPLSLLPLHMVALALARADASLPPRTTTTSLSNRFKDYHIHHLKVQTSSTKRSLALQAQLHHGVWVPSRWEPARTPVALAKRSNHPLMCLQACAVYCGMYAAVELRTIDDGPSEAFGRPAEAALLPPCPRRWPFPRSVHTWVRLSEAHGAFHVPSHAVLSTSSNNQSEA